MTTKLDEFSLNLPVQAMGPEESAPDEYATSQAYSDDAAVVLSPDNDHSAMTIGNPVPADAQDPKMISVFSSSISPISYGQSDEAVAAFDVVFSVGIACADGTSKTYQIVKRIGIDKVKIAAEVSNGAPVSIVEAKEAPVETTPKTIKESVTRISNTTRFRQLAGLE